MLKYQMYLNIELMFYQIISKCQIQVKMSNYSQMFVIQVQFMSNLYRFQGKMLRWNKICQQMCHLSPNISKLRNQRQE